jgi:menaquinone-dependent protoporphyrinogen oxidase
MKVLVAVASKHGATQGIARYVAETMRAAGHQAETRLARSVPDIAGYDAVVIGGATYLGHWLKEAADFAERNAAALRSRPVWLFSCGPLGAAEIDVDGRETRVNAEPAEITDLAEAVGAVGHRVFYGALDPARLGFRDRVIRAMPAGKGLLPEGDFRDWPEIEAWAATIASTLAGQPPRERP